ncbi:hypothetical protein NIB75_19120 [Bacteroides uniformis]|nr:hypothetical protein [Bacteroides uniformis]
MFSGELGGKQARGHHERKSRIAPNGGNTAGTGGIFDNGASSCGRTE